MGVQLMHPAQLIISILSHRYTLISTSKIANRHEYLARITRLYQRCEVTGYVTEKLQIPKRGL